VPVRSIESICFAIVAGVSRSFLKQKSDRESASITVRRSKRRSIPLAQGKIVDQADEYPLVFVRKAMTLALMPSGYSIGCLAHSVAGQNTGTPIEIEDALNFSRLQNIRARQKVPFERTPNAYAKMLVNEARFRMVLEMTPSN
jgi:hypothetical protein